MDDLPQASPALTGTLGSLAGAAVGFCFGSEWAGSGQAASDLARAR